MPTKRPFCLTIAGFDPSGGAGIVADCKTFEQLKVQGLSVMTANTVQTEDRFIATNWIPLETILQQLTTLLERYSIRYFKIGLVENAGALLAILDTIHRHTQDPFIAWDPILQPTAGGDLSSQRFAEQLPVILSRIQLITPNIPEYEALFGTTDPAAIARQYTLSVYLKGGHSADKGKDLLFTADNCYPFAAHVHTTLSKHGTGCILSSALLAHRALRYPVVKGALLSKRYLERTLVSNETLLGYHSR
jgi:hydroxymethylpyrimidine/phosphomethylpyrimidine kinase